MKEITNCIENFYYCGDGCFSQLDKRFARGLVEVDLGRALLTDLDIHGATSLLGYTLTIGAFPIIF